jgi:hypothetical protein
MGKLFIHHGGGAIKFCVNTVTRAENKFLVAILSSSGRYEKSEM